MKFNAKACSQAVSFPKKFGVQDVKDIANSCVNFCLHRAIARWKRSSGIHFRKDNRNSEIESIIH